METLDRVAAGDTVRIGEVEGHLAACDSCRSRLALARRDARLSAELRAANSNGTAGSIDGYEILGELQRGGQGVVHRALQLGTRREVALKVLTEVTARDRHRFEREIGLVCRLRHPSIVTIFDSGVADGRAYYAMELVDGERLDRFVRERGVARRERLELFVQIADAVAYAHRCGVIHRDLKPDNILVDSGGRPHLLDFGIATALEGGLRITATGEFMGTLAYASPEQVLGEAPIVDLRTDVYSLGVVLYELVTGRLPHELSSNVNEAIGTISRGRPLDPRGVAPDVDSELRAILLCALAREPAERYASADALASDVRRWLSGESPAAGRTNVWRALRKQLRRHRLAIAGMTLLVAGAGGRIGGRAARAHARGTPARERAARAPCVPGRARGGGSAAHGGGRAPDRGDRGRGTFDRGGVG